MSTRVATPWGSASVIEEVRIAQEAEERTFASLVQLLEDGSGERLVRFAYTTDGVVRRGPVTLREADLDRLREALRSRRQLGRMLGLRPPRRVPESQVAGP